MWHLKRYYAEQTKMLANAQQRRVVDGKNDRVMPVV
jgi:hypothetical protein